MPKRILVIDDEELVLKSITKLLEKAGYDVIACQAGEEALQKIKRRAVDLIVCDVRMPKLNGIETIQEIRKILNDQKNKTTPEILITGYADEIQNKQIESLGVKEYLYKPFDLRDFLSCIKRSLGD